MTMHNAKGLEFPYVFIVGIEEGLIPHRNSMDDPAQMEEERRLFYVAMTRTQEELSLSYANNRRVYGSSIPTIQSKFLDEIPEKYVEKYEYNLYTSRKYNFSHNNYQKGTDWKKQKKFDWQTNNSSFKVGQKISHAKFGRGTILSIKGNEGNIKLTISFENGKLKKILSNYVSKYR